MTHVVRAGETLSSIARRHGSSVPAIRVANGLSGDRIGVGQRLVVPSARRTHVVRNGETLHRIAERYGTTVSTLKRLNNLRRDLIHPRQVLIVP